jgi:hypothetical protein
MSDSKVNIKVIFDGVAQSAMSATRRLSGEIKQLGAESKRAASAMAGIGRGMMKGLEGGAMFGAGAMMGYKQFVAPMVKAAETYEEAVTRATVAFMNAQGKTSENFPKLVALSEKLSVDYAGSAKNFLEIATTLRQGQVKEEVILKSGLKAVADLATIKQATSDEDFKRIAGQVNVFLDAFKLPEEKIDAFVNDVQKAKYAFELETEDLAESVKYSMSAITNLGMTGSKGAKDVLTMFGVLKQAGQAGSLAGTNFDEFAKGMARATEGVAKLRKKGLVGKEFQMSFFDNNEKFLGLENALKELDKLKPLSEKRRLEVVTELFGDTGGRFASAILSKGGVETFREYGKRYAERAEKELVIGMLQGTATLKKESMMGALENAAAKAGEGLNEIQKRVFDFVGNDVAGWMSANPNLTLTGGIIGMIGSGLATYFGAMKGKEYLSKAISGGATATNAASQSLLVDAAGRPLSSSSLASSAPTATSRALGIGGRALSFLGRLNPFAQAALTGLTAYDLAMRKGVTAEDVKNMQVRAASESGGRFGQANLGRLVEINYQPTVTIQGASETERERFLKLLQQHKEEIARAVDQVQARKQTISFTR